MKPKVDFCFKELMEDAEIREGFLSALLKIQPEEIKETELLATHLRREHPGDKLGILDIRILVRYWTEKEQNGLKGREQVNWARFFNAEQKEEFEMAAETNLYIEKAYERLADISADEEMRLECEAREKAIRDHNYLMKTSLELG